ncbi:EamA family transporter RarD [Jonesia quinghaiensis]|uniref:EamA family transporter RarD n=1 Tax=Jonesia quinghaiensis TaxID=262806 RepID=UPI00041ADDD3|nr:EamA family transporter RarD [Jonesia quinghaiensis]
MNTAPSSPVRLGLAAGIGAYVIWGFLPFYFAAIDAASPWEIIAWRIVFTTIFCLALLAITGTLRTGWRAARPAWLSLTAASLLIVINWLVYVYGVSTKHILDTSLGYYINPLVTVLLAVIVLRERIRPLQWVALGIGATAVLVMTAGLGRFPWIAVVLACSFGLYSLVKAKVGRHIDSITSLAAETIISTPVAVTLLVLIGTTSGLSIAAHGPTHLGLILASGIVTGLPLILFGTAARRLPLATVGILQYLAPTLQFIIGYLVFHEPMPTARWVGFALVWVALTFFTIDAVRQARSSRLRQPRVTDTVDLA